MQQKLDQMHIWMYVEIVFHKDIRDHSFSDLLIKHLKSWMEIWMEKEKILILLFIIYVIYALTFILQIVAYFFLAILF